MDDHVIGVKDKTLEKVELPFQGFHSMGIKLMQCINPSSEGLSIEEFATDDTQKSMDNPHPGNGLDVFPMIFMWFILILFLYYTTQRYNSFATVLCSGNVGASVLQQFILQ